MKIEPESYWFKVLCKYSEPGFNICRVYILICDTSTVAYVYTYMIY